MSGPICENGVCRMPDTDDEDFKRIMARIKAAQKKEALNDLGKEDY